MIDLKFILEKYPDCLNTRTRLAGLLRDLYPDEKRLVNIVLAVYQSGIAARIAKLKEIDTMQLHAFTKLLDDEHGLQEQYAIQGIELWAKAYDVKTVQLLATQSICTSSSSQIKAQPQRAAAPQAIVHDLNAYSRPEIVQGNVSEYELRAINDHSVEIVKFRGFEQAEMAVPNIIDGKKVAGIGNGAYKNCQGMTTLTIPEGILYIGGGAFSGCIHLKNVQLPTSLLLLSAPRERLSGAAFSGCTSLTTIDLPNGITEIPEGTFYGCSFFKGINLSNQLKIIGDYAFSSCKLNHIMFPNTLKEIGKSAFSLCRQLNYVVCPSTLKKIKKGAFSDCERMQRIILNEGLEAIEEEAFEKCAIKEIVIPNTVSMIETRTGLFSNVFNLDVTLYCYAGSYGLQWAREHGFTVKNAAEAPAYLLDPSAPRP